MTTKRYVKTEATALGMTSVQIVDTETGFVFLEREGNRHYDEYKAWLEAGNTPDVVYTNAVCEIPGGAK